MLSRYDPVLFDLDGTLIDSGADIAASANRTLLSLGLPELPQQEIIGFVGDGIRRTMQRALSHADRTDVDEAVRRFRADYRDNCVVHTAPYPGIRDVLHRLRSQRIGVVTNKLSNLAVAILEGLDLRSSFATVVGGDETERIKPHPDPILLACERLGVDPEGGIMVGDFINDIQAGRAAGMTTCGVLWGFDRGLALRQAKPDFQASTPAELQAVLFKG